MVLLKLHHFNTRIEKIPTFTAGCQRRTLRAVLFIFLKGMRSQNLVARTITQGKFEEKPILEAGDVT